ncbi:unnamed protein product [Prorocentrum cordatum]|uniref:Uncharacterized protein n=1 Tax=Prorocentrum cordatum TaxID=2364126 RepID=A0ABN9XRR6_9DINO|nr:unnamed protein product [Polarella glacialis]
MGGTECRFSPENFETWKSKVKSNVSRQKFAWCVPNVNDVLEECKEFFVDTTGWPTLPPGYDPNTEILLDARAKVERLGPNVDKVSWKVDVGTEGAIASGVDGLALPAPAPAASSKALPRRKTRRRVKRRGALDDSGHTTCSSSKGQANKKSYTWRCVGHECWSFLNSYLAAEPAAPRCGPGMKPRNHEGDEPTL